MNRISFAIISLISLSQSEFGALTDVLHCDDPGLSEATCIEECDFDKQICAQEVKVNTCSCNYTASRQLEMVVHDFQGNLLSSPGCSLVTQRCEKCSDFCSQLNPTSPTSQRKYKGNTQQTECKPKVQLGARTGLTEFGCSDRGNLTRLCTEICHEDGETCKTKVKIDACTCGGRILDLSETVTYDIASGQLIDLGEPLQGYSRVCGDCVDFCKFRPGEAHSYHVNDYITSCYVAH